MEKICPIMSYRDPVTDRASNGALMSSETWSPKDCVGNKCQWWWKCGEPEIKCGICGRLIAKGESFYLGKNYENNCRKCFKEGQHAT